MKASLIITTYNRSEYLYHVLKSIQSQDLKGLDLEVLVVNDGLHDETENVTLHSDAVKGLNTRYIHTGHRHGLYWRCMGFAANVGIRQATGDVVILSNSDIFHLGNTIKAVVQGSILDPYALSTLHEVYDDDGLLIQALQATPYDEEESRRLRTTVVDRIRRSPRPQGFWPCNPDVPFCMAIRREHLMKLRGYDEDFIGVASEDCDLLDRLKKLGCHYRYAPKGCEAVHLHHGRKSIEELKALPGFHHNVKLRNERKNDLIRNPNREWGKLIDTTIPQEESPLGMVLWVTSRCNLHCPKCSQHPVMAAHQNYEMDLEELEHFIRSCQQRNLRFTFVELTGGEPTGWPLFELAVKRLVNSRITERVTFITNGSNPELAVKVANHHNLHYVVSKTQATPRQITYHEKHGVGVLWNTEPHKSCPSTVQQENLPANCSQRQARDGQVVRELAYIQGKVWYCCTAKANMFRVGTEDSTLFCDFNEDFDSFFKHRNFDKPVCGVCLCNAKVWERLDE
jgi:GT2 family glycosyltransferase/organic radical activating enzyme